MRSLWLSRSSPGSRCGGRSALVVGVLLMLGGAAPALAGPTVLAGHDLFSTGDGAVQDFSSFPIPADFFFPGSDPFNSIIDLEGEPLGSWDGFSGLGNTDTIVKRLDDALLPVNPPPDQTAPTIDIEIVALSLRSVSPITVTSGGPDTFWDVFVDIDTTAPPLVTPSLGTMDITQTSATGGFYSAHLEVFPQFTFVKIGGPPSQVALDFGLLAAGPAAVLDTANNPTWEYTPTHNQLVVPGLTGPNFYIFGPIVHTGPHPIEVAVPEPASGGLLLLGLAGLAAGRTFLRQRDRRSA